MSLFKRLSRRNLSLLITTFSQNAKLVEQASSQKLASLYLGPSSQRQIMTSSIKLNNVNDDKSKILNEETNTTEQQSENQGQQQESQGDEISIEEKILKNAMKYVPQFGFTREALSQGLKFFCRLFIVVNEFVFF